MKRTNNKELNLNQSLTGCAPCLNEVSKIERKIGERALTKIKIDEIKKIVNSIFTDQKIKNNVI